MPPSVSTATGAADFIAYYTDRASRVAIGLRETRATSRALEETLARLTAGDNGGKSVKAPAEVGDRVFLRRGAHRSPRG